MTRPELQCLTPTPRLHPRRSGSGSYQTVGHSAWYGAMIGHVEPVLTLPIGLERKLRHAGTIRMLEPAVVNLTVSLYDSPPQLKAPYKFLLKGLY